MSASASVSSSGGAGSSSTVPVPAAAPAPASDSMSVLENAFARFSDGVVQLQSTSQVAQKRLELEFSALDGCVKTHEVQLKEYRKLSQMIDEVEREQGSTPLLSDYRLKLSLLRTSLDTLRDTRPRQDLGWFMRLMVGRVPMTLWKHSDRIRFKDEYNKFKARTTLIFIVWPLLQLSLMFIQSRYHLEGHWAELLLQAHQLWLLYYYTTLSLRENILLANGSDILHWWIYHHYLSMLISVIMILWPNPYLVSERVLEMQMFGLVQGLVMLFQNNYQKKRLYVRKTLGKARAIDVDSSETLVEKPTDLQVLIPLLFALYAIELWFGVSFLYAYMYRTTNVAATTALATTGAAVANGTSLLTSAAAPAASSSSSSSLRYPVSVLVMGVAFIILAIGNAWTTGLVLVSKSKSRHLKQMVQQRVAAISGRNRNNASSSGAGAAAKKKE